MDWISDPQLWIGLLTLTVLEVVLGIDNVIFISLLAGKLPAAQQPRARTIGLGLAMITRIALLFSLTWVMRLTEPLFSIGSWELSGKALIRIDIDGTNAGKGDEWDMGTRIREVEEGPDGAIWLLEDGQSGSQGRLLKLTPLGSGAR